jgi:aspartate-semialdehyde dehydrogenase
LKNINVAVLGATGLVGHEFVNVLTQRNFPLASLRLLASDRSAGKNVIVGSEEYEVTEAGHRSFDHIDIALFSAGSDASEFFAPVAVKAGAVVVDNSAAFRMETDVPLVIPEVNPDDIRNHQGIVLLFSW